MSDSEDTAGETRKPTPRPLPVWAKAGRIVAVAGAVALFVIAYLTWRADPADEASLERIGGWIFNAMVIGVLLLFVGRFQSRR